MLIKRRRRKILGIKRKQMFENLKKITKEIYNKYTRLSPTFYKSYFPCFKLAKNYGGYHFHFLVIKKEYGG